MNVTKWIAFGALSLGLVGFVATNVMKKDTEVKSVQPAAQAPAVGNQTTPITPEESESSVK